MKSSVYVYCIIPDVNREDWGQIGIDGARVHAIAGDGVAALVHDMPAVPYQGPDEDVKRWVLEHSDVVEQAWRSAATVLPVTFNVIVRGDSEVTAERRLLDWLAGNAAALAGRLDALRDRVELRVEIDLQVEASSREDPAVAALQLEIPGKPAGLRRLLEKRLEQLMRDAANRAADSLYRESRRRLASVSEDIVEIKRHRPLVDHVPVLAASLLVPLSAVESVGAELAALKAENPAVNVRFLGPWPPYSFANVAPGGDQAAADSNDTGVANQAGDERRPRAGTVK